MILDFRFSILFRITALALACAIQAAQEPGPWRIVFEQGGELASVLADGTDRRGEKGAGLRGGVLSPDGTRLAYTSYDDGDSEVWVSDADGKNARKLTDNNGVDAYPDWTRDGKRLVFASDRDGKSQIWIMDADGKNATRLTRHDGGALDGRVSPKGDRISYREIHPNRDKVSPSTLRVMDLAGGDSKPLIEKALFLDHAWSPQGDLILCSLINEMKVVESSSGKVVKAWETAAIHKDLYAHAAGSLAWRPDGKAFACQIQFLGGRHGDVTIFGDNQIFIVPLEGKPVVVETGGPASPVRWIR